jgi:cytochrome c biogenesis protein CcmG/thiol:disulfide interchange protein DsbE
MRKKTLAKRAIVGALIVVALGGLVWAALAPAPADRKPTAIPAFELEVLGGSGTISADDLEGKPVVLNFWASWCGPCNREAPALENAWQRYKQDGVMFLGVDVRDIEDAAKAFVKKHGITYPSVRDPDQTLVSAMKLGDPLPQTFFIGADGKIRGGSGIGEITAEELEREIDLLLEEPGSQ